MTPLLTECAGLITDRVLVPSAEVVYDLISKGSFHLLRATLSMLRLGIRGEWGLPLRYSGAIL